MTHGILNLAISGTEGDISVIGFQTGLNVAK